MWDSDAGTALSRIQAHQDAVRSVVYSPDGHYLLTASWDGSAKIWDSTGGQAFNLRGHTNRINSAAYRPDGLTIVTASDDRTALVWDANPIRSSATRINLLYPRHRPECPL